MQPMLPASDSNSQTVMPAPRLGPIPLMVTHLMSPHLTQEMRDNLVSDAFLALPSPAQNATIRAYAQAIEMAAAAATDRQSTTVAVASERHSLKCKDESRNMAYMQASLQDRVVRLEADVERLDAERLKMLERAVAAEKERDLLKAHVRKIYDSRVPNRAAPLRNPEAETFLPALMPAVASPSSPVAAPAAEAASPKCQASEPPDGAGSPTYARLLEKARHGYLEASVLMQEARHVEAFTRRPL